MAMKNLGEINGSTGNPESKTLVSRLRFILSKFSSLSKLDLLLSLVLCLFILSLGRLVLQKRQVAVVLVPMAAPMGSKPDSNINLTRSGGYYDYEPYLGHTIEIVHNKSRRYFYLDLGCFDGRDIDHFIHFHAEDIAKNGTLNIIAFEPDPINFSACRSRQRKHTTIPITIYDTAVWTSSGKVRYATEKGQKSKIDPNSALSVKSIDFSKWLIDHFTADDYIYVKFSVEGVDIPILEKMVLDGSLALVDHMEIEWSDFLAPEFEPRRVVLECMFDNFGMDFLYMINPVDSRHAFSMKDSYNGVAKDKGW